MSDILTIMLTDIREAQPTDEHRFMEWLESIGQVIRAFPTEIRRGAAMILVANDICVATGLSLIECCKVVVRAVEAQKGVRT